MSADRRGGGPPGNGDTSGEPPLPSPPYPTSPRSVDGRISAMAVRRRGRGFTRVVGGGSAGPIVTGSARRGAARGDSAGGANRLFRQAICVSLDRVEG
jgi:hypothetical protein